jgi:hypothetical protein
MSKIVDSRLYDELLKYRSTPQPKPHLPYVTTSYNIKDLFRQLRDMRIPMTGNRMFLAPEKEKEPMGSNYDNDGRSNQQKIDDAVREEIEAPRRAAEIAKRVAAVKALEPIVAGAVGTVVTFNKKLDRGDKTSYAYAAIKVSDDAWALTGDGQYTNGNRLNSKDFLSHLVTGPNAAEDVQAATEFAPVA